ncbi:MAG: type I methionyl aminopeptidase [Bdellovibrionales bacterium RIFOXYB1_FULL_37_110]|nr:MAG: type I methionyl aminopeptidase [Bdellovibrionales bacterium RIFOXYA1_FULL_38_20]OFZ51538.1 MAG: type I methionyl aminopeptidase [Bdellovibrionales bacterium RIFOXYC1_FULL_37_79]OFZ60372.1 MAG: type I methionyl aminopeptidase [Bdellovibrionales bacterium RIFOXYB1_FULL_37_110]OFZ63862.1 MAG: type I methionyl aminopeptidase [Bdellovibrionales bacterium RIFOXYD1_FULL_36_51]
MIAIKSKREIELMRKTCALASETLQFIEPYIKPGVSTEKLNELCHEYIISHGATPSPLNYHGFPKSICTSLNEVICHGIPSSKDVLKSGDILNVDITTFLEGFHGDTSATFLVGVVDPQLKKLVEVTYECMLRGIRVIKPGKKTGDIGHAIETYALEQGFSVVEEYCGHGIGRSFHEDPQILHYGDKNKGTVLKEGMIFTVEPMINLGERFCEVLKDNWTVVTKDGWPSAQYEHTILVTSNGYEVLTLRSGEII